MTGSLLFVTRKFPPSVGGMENLAAGVWRSLERHTPDALLIAHGRSNEQLPYWLPSALIRVADLLIRRRVRVVLAGDALMYTVLFPLLKLGGVRHATMVMGLDLTYENRIYRAIVHRVLRRAPRVIAISAATAEVARSFGIPADRVTVVRPGVPSPRVTSEDRAVAVKEIRQRYNLPDDAFVLLTLGRLVRRKGARWLIEHVLAELPTNVVYLLAGDGPEREAILSAAATAGEHRVRLLGQVDDDDREVLLRGADVFIQPNVPVPGDMEGFGLVTIEAAMRGTPTVASGIEGIRDAVIDGETGILLPAGDAAAWAERLRGLCSDPVAASALGGRFRSRARELYSEEAMAQRLLDEIARLES